MLPMTLRYNSRMEFHEIKALFESELVRELGAEQPFRMVPTGQWTGRCTEGDGEVHLSDIPRACFNCHKIHVPDWEYDDFTEARVGASVEMIVEQLERG